MIVTYLPHVIQKYKLGTCSCCLLGGRDALKLITLHVPETYLRALDKLVNDRYYPNRAEAIRVAIRDLINEEVWGKNQVG